MRTFQAAATPSSEVQKQADDEDMDPTVCCNSHSILSMFGFFLFFLFFSFWVGLSEFIKVDFLKVSFFCLTLQCSFYAQNVTSSFIFYAGS